MTCYLGEGEKVDHQGRPRHPRITELAPNASRTTVIITVTDLKQKHEHNDGTYEKSQQRSGNYLKKKKNTVAILEQKNAMCKIKYSLAGSG